ncbi:MAG: FG-GAP and VCBS repeat-containing protein [Candidatus Micrarchaeia archaeon]
MKSKTLSMLIILSYFVSANYLPLITGVDMEKYVNVGEEITFKIYWHDPDSERVSARICKQPDFEACTPICSTELSEKNPIDCIYTAHEEDESHNVAYIFINDENGTGLTAPLTVKTGRFPLSISVGDLYKGGADEIVVLSKDYVEIFSYENNNFISKKIPAVMPHSSCITDFDGDGKNEIIYANSTLVFVACPDERCLRSYSLPSITALGCGKMNNTPAIFIGTSENEKGEGALHAITPDGIRDFASFPYPSSIAFADADNDGEHEVVIASLTKGDIFVSKGLSSTKVGACKFPRSVAVGDINNDSKNEIAVACYGSDEMLVFPQNLRYSIEKPSWVAIGNISGMMHVACVSEVSNSVMLVAGGKKTTLPILSPSAVGMGDVDGDGISDLIVSNLNNDSISVYLARRFLSVEWNVNHAPKIQDPPFISEFESNATIACEKANFTDAENDTISIITRWFINEELVEENTSVLRVPIKVGDGIRCEQSAVDARGASTPFFSSNSVLIKAPCTCAYKKNFTCVPYECCNNSDCDFNKKCVAYACVPKDSNDTAGELANAKLQSITELINRISNVERAQQVMKKASMAKLIYDKGQYEAALILVSEAENDALTIIEEESQARVGQIVAILIILLVLALLWVFAVRIFRYRYRI